MLRQNRPLLVRLAIALAIFVLGVAYYAYLVRTGPEPEQRPAIRNLPVVEVMELQPTDYQVRLPSQGIVRPRTQTDLTAEVAGKIAKISDNFLNGADFKPNEVLVELDSRNYQTALARAEAELTRAQTALTLAQAATEKARTDWKRLGLRGSPTDLNLKIPQQREAEANVKAAEADVAEAKLNVERCRIAAPYAGRVLAKQVDVGQFVSPGTMLGQIYSTEMFEVRLPLRNDQLAFLNLKPEDGSKPAVLLTGENRAKPAPRSELELTPGENSHPKPATDQWPAWIERTEAAVDARSRQLFVIAAIDTSLAGAPLLPSGTFVQAQVEGELLREVYVVPRKAVRSGNTVVRIGEGNKVAFQKLDIVYDGDPDQVVARAGNPLKPGTRISLTPIPFVDEGDRVTIDGEQNAHPERGGRPPLARGPKPGKSRKTPDT